MIILALLLSSCGQNDPVLKPILWDLSLPWSPQEFHTANAQRFVDAVKARSGGRLVIRVHAGGVLGIKGPEALRALAEGVVHMAEMPGVQQVGTAPLLGLESLPFLARNQKELKLLDRLTRPAIDQALQRHGVKLLYRVPWPNQNLFFKDRLETLQAMAGLRIRTYDRVTGELMTRLGLVPVQMALGDVVPALASGAVDATMTSATSAAAQRYWEFMDYVFRSNHTWLINLMAVDLDAWDRLPADLQQLLQQTAMEMEADFWEVAAADDQDKLARLEAAGMGVLIPSPAVQAQMTEVAQPMWQAFAQQAGPEAEYLLAAYLDQRP